MTWHLFIFYLFILFVSLIYLKNAFKNNSYIQLFEYTSMISIFLNFWMKIVKNVKVMQVIEKSLEIKTLLRAY